MSGRSKRVVPLSMVAASVVGLWGRVAHATPLIFEDFDPPGTGGDLSGTPASATGLTGNWFNASSPGAPYYTSGNAADQITRSAGQSANGTALVYPTNSSLPAPAGGTARKAAGGYPNDFYQANIATPIPLSGAAGTYYFSYLLDNAAGNVDYAAQIALGGASTQIYAGFGYGSKDDISVRANHTLPFNAGNTYDASGGSFAAGFSGGNLGLVVGQLVTTASGADTVGVRIFRYTAGGAAAALPVDASGLTFDATYAFTSTDTLTQLGVFEAGVTTPEVDAIRVGTTYADVVGNVTGVTPGGPFTTYTGAVNGAFDTSTANFSFNGSSVAFANGNSVLFDNTATGTRNVVVAAGGVAPSAVTFNNTVAGAGYVLTGGAITSPGTLTTLGSGTVTLNNSNAYAGGVNLSNGSVVLGTGGRLATSTFAQGAGTLNFDGGTLQALTDSTTFITGTTANVLAGGGTIDTQGFNVTVAEALSGSASSPGGGVTKVGSGTLTLQGNSTYTGGTTVNGGNLRLTSGGSAGGIRGPLTINAGATVTAVATDAIGFTAGVAVNTLTVNSGGTFVLGAGNEGYVTNLVVNGGTVSATAGGSFNFNTGYGITSGAAATTGTIASDVAIRGTSLNVTTAAGNTSSGVDLAITGRVLGGTAAVLNTFGPGTVLLSGANTFGAGTNVTGGTLVVANAATLGRTIDNAGVTLTGGRLVLGSLAAPATAVSLPEDLYYAGGGTLQLTPTPAFSSGTVASVNITDNGVVALRIGSGPAAGVTHGLLTTTAINFASTTGGSFDVGRNDLDLTTSSLPSVNAMVASGFNSGAGNGPGLSSAAVASDAAHLHALGVIANSDASGPLYGNGGSIAASFDGAAPAPGDILVKYTYFGDTNLDGVVNAADYIRTDVGSVNGLTGWYNGDFNYDGIVDGSDYALMDNAFNHQTGAIASVVAAPSAQLAGTSAVPEPASLAVVAAGGAALLGSRRRRGR